MLWQMPWAERAIAAVSSLESDCLSYMKNWKSWDWKRTGHLHTLQVTYTLKDQIRKAQKKCPEIKASMKTGHHQDYRVDEQGTQWLKQRICVPQNQQIRDAIFSEAHNSKYSIHPGCTKMYCDLCFLSFSISVGMPSPFFIIHHQCLLWLVLFLLYFFWNLGRISYIYILIYVDDIIVTGNSSSAMKHLWHTLHQQFSIKDLGQLHFWVLRSPLLVQVSFLLNIEKST